MSEKAGNVAMNLLAHRMAGIGVPNHFTRTRSKQGDVRMTNDPDGYTHQIDEPELNLSPPRFDDEASANAQPVQPIPASRVSAFRNHVASIRRAVGTKFGALTLVVIAGLLAGILCGMVWVKVGQVTDTPPATSESVSEIAPASKLIDLGTCC